MSQSYRARLPVSPWTLGVTGTREDLPELFEGIVRPIVDDYVDNVPITDPLYVVVGACVGTDDRVARYLHRRGVYVHAIVPANIKLVAPDWREHCSTFEIMPPHSSYRARDQQIVDLAHFGVLAFPLYPEADPASRRSGTWLTVRLARRSHRYVEAHVLRPGGSRAAQSMALRERHRELEPGAGAPTPREE